jgi:hypothetical protein
VPVVHCPRDSLAAGHEQKEAVLPDRMRTFGGTSEMHDAAIWHQTPAPWPSASCDRTRALTRPLLSSEVTARDGCVRRTGYWRALKCVGGCGVRLAGSIRRERVTKPLLYPSELRNRAVSPLREQASQKLLGRKSRDCGPYPRLPAAPILSPAQQPRPRKIRCDCRPNMTRGRGGARAGSSASASRNEQVYPTVSGL